MIEDLTMATKKELENEMKLLEEHFDKTRFELMDYIKTTEDFVKEKSEYMEELSNRYNEIKAEVEKRDGKSSE